jgi:tRNA-specific 2-thiouridylase
MPFYVFDFCADFRAEVMDRFVTAYQIGSTPNPCIDCNRYIKYKRLYDRMRAMDFDLVVTGHYAETGLDEESGRYFLKRGVDDTKDQSYVLYALTQEQLAHTMFPLGDLAKSEVRAIAAEHGFVNAAKKDSQDICFVRDGDYGSFIESYSGKQFSPGNFVDRDGNVLGRHQGVARYTIGQRKGLGIALGQPAFVTEIRPGTNEIVLGSNDDLFGAELYASDVNLISVASIEAPMRVAAKIRYSASPEPATVVQTDSDRIKVAFDKPQRAITRGQAVVLYDGDLVVGGGTIE